MAMTGGSPEASQFDATTLHNAEVTATSDGTGVDIRNQQGRGSLLQIASLVTGSSPTLDTTIEESSDDGSSDAFAAVTGLVFPQATAAGVQRIDDVDVDSLERFIRTAFVVTGSTPSFAVTVLLLSAGHVVS